jgi:transposase InsO family protein
MELLPVKNYFGNFIFNSYKLEREYEWVELTATDRLSQTFDQGDYGRKSIGFAFRLFVEPEVNFGRYNECIYSMGKTKIFHIACHLDYAYFTSISQPEQLKVFEYIEGWYNKRRRHAALGNTSPEQYQFYLEAIRMAA